MPFSRVGEKLHSNYNQALALEIGETRKARDDLQVAEKLFREQGNTDMVQTIQTILKRIPN